MDWFRKLLGWDNGPSIQPPQNRGFDESHRRRDRDTFGDFWGDSSVLSSPFGSVIQQMDEMMLEMMRDIHQSPGIHVYTYDQEDRSPANTNPRDAMLKNPDSEITQPAEGPCIPHEGFQGPELPHDSWGSSHDSQYIDSENGDFDEFQGFGGSPFHRHPGNPFGMMESILKSFGGGGFFGTFSHDSDNFPGGPNWNFRIDQSPRESMLKSDGDLDSSVSENLLKEGPHYEHPSPPGQIQSQPQPHPVPSVPGQPSVHYSYSSSSYSYVRKPDGSIEETHKYRDSSGREEVTVTTREPDNRCACPPTPNQTPTPSPPGGIVPDPGHPGDPEYSTIFNRLFGK